jgi:formiminotetrahydrofolate cyclodeaminase
MRNRRKLPVDALEEKAAKLEELKKQRRATEDPWEIALIRIRLAMLAWEVSLL